jgi:hypothetical protein
MPSCCASTRPFARPGGPDAFRAVESWGELLTQAIGDRHKTGSGPPWWTTSERDAATIIGGWKRPLDQIPPDKR